MTPTPPPTDDKLLPCPFCGETAGVLFTPTCDRKTPYNPADRAFPIVRCASCFAEAHGTDWDQRGKTAIAAWNTRAALRPEPSPIRTKLPSPCDDEALERELVEAVKIARTSDATAQVIERDFPELKPQPSPDDAAVLDQHESAALQNDNINGCGPLALQMEAEYQRTRAAVLARMDRRAKPLTWDTLICTGCLHVGDKPPPPALSCCPERKPVKLAQLCEGRRAVIEACARVAENCDGISRDGYAYRTHIAAAIRALADKETGNG